MATMTIADLCSRHRVNMAHGRHVGELAATLLKKTRPLHQLDPRYDAVMFHAGLLHNVGLSDGVSKHHTRGRDILLNVSLTDLPDTDRLIIAVTTFFHRKRWKPERLLASPTYTGLPPEAQYAARWMAPLIRIADGLDYSHSQGTIITRMEVTDQAVRLHVDGLYADWDAQRAHKKCDMWLDVIGIPITVRG